MCGFRNEEDQNKAFDEGKSKLRWPHGNHNKKPSRAVDVVPWPLDWGDRAKFDELAEVVKRHAKRLDIKVSWGGDWKTFLDLPHWELA
jgi:peptidoglycan LD-endopeptidase CwlK